MVDLHRNRRDEDAFHFDEEEEHHPRNHEEEEEEERFESISIGYEDAVADEGVVHGVEATNVVELSPPSVSCFYRLRQELKCSYAFFSLDELNGTVLDINNTFAPDPIVWTVLARIVLLGLAIGAMVYSIVKYPDENRWIWMGFLTHWTVVVTIAYFLVMLLFCNCNLFRSTYLEQPARGQPVSVLVRLAWFFYSLALPMNVLVVLLYWTLDYTPGQAVTFNTISLHAGTCFLVLIDGNIVSKIPIRFKHIVLVESAGLLLVVWTLINDLVGIGDGRWDGEDANQNNKDDALYSVLDWSDSPGKAAIISVVVLLVVVPLVFFLCWSLSLWSRWLKFDGSRRCICQEARKQNAEEEKVEEGLSEDVITSIGAGKWIKIVTIH